MEYPRVTQQLTCELQRSRRSMQARTVQALTVLAVPEVKALPSSLPPSEKQLFKVHALDSPQAC